jgi:hypothetical protein
MKSLFNEDFSWTDTGRDIDQEFTKVLEPIFSKYSDLGYSPREIAEIFHGVVDSRKYKALKDFKDKSALDSNPRQYVILSRKKDGEHFYTTHNSEKNYEKEGYDVLGYTDDLAEAEKNLTTKTNKV